jgi:hypothetical protein
LVEAIRPWVMLWQLRGGGRGLLFRSMGEMDQQSGRIVPILWEREFQQSSRLKVLTDRQRRARVYVLKQPTPAQAGCQWKPEQSGITAAGLGGQRVGNGALYRIQEAPVRRLTAMCRLD